jgi:O-phosphoseryl-tRNA synthetase
MNSLDPKDILSRVEEEGFEKVWRESASLLPEPAGESEVASGKRGVSHPLYDLIQKLRLSFLDLGFKEVFNPVVVDENEVYKQYGPEAPIILDRCYYLATLPRPDIGLSRAKYEEIEKTGVTLTEAKVSALQQVLRDYKKGEVDSDDLVERIAEAFEVSDTLAMRVISDVFPQFSALRPEPSRLTLRSHMTTAWFLTLQALQHKTELPLKLFSVDIRFRREQREDPTHLRVHHSASCVIMKEEIGSEKGEEVTRALLKPFGFENFRFVRKKVPSKYYAPGMEYEGFIFNPAAKKWIEVVDYGIYSPIALARYNLECPVLNVGVGVERLAMALYNEEDMRRLVYPQFYMSLALSDAEIVKMIRFEIEPKTKKGKEIAKKIVSEALENADAPSPCEFLAYEGDLLDKKVRVYVYEKEKDARLLGAAARNSLYVYDGNIVGVPSEGMNDVSLIRETRERGVSKGIRYVDGIASLAAAKIEEAVEIGRERLNVRVRLARRPSDINVEIGNTARRYITSHKKKIEISGPIFIGIRAEITD